MSSFIPNVLKQNHQRLAILSSRALTTTSDPKKALGLAVGLKDLQGAGQVQKSLYPAAPIPNADVFSYTFENANKWQHKTFTECAITGRRYTYGQTVDGALRWAAAITKLLPNEPNPTIAFITPNTPEYPIMFFGCCAAGATVTPINPTYTPEEIAFHLNDSGASLLVVDALVEPLADLSFKLMGRSLPVVVNGPSKQGRPNVQELISNRDAPMSDPKDIDPNSIAFLPYSSGTTGKPKGAKVSHAALTNNMAMYLNKYYSVLNGAEGDHQDNQIGILPFFHIYGVMTTLLPSAYFGSRILTMPKFDPMLFATALKKDKMTSIQVVAPLMKFVVECPMITCDDLEPLRACVSGAAPVDVDVANALKQKAKNIFIQEGYGMTETLLTHVTAINAEKIGYCGQLLPNASAKIVDLETGELLPANSTGELYIKSNGIMSGYHNNEAANKDIFVNDGWLRTGDVAIYTEDGYYAIVDRIKELIKVKGMQVSPSEIEETLQKLPGIAEVGVVGIPHSNLGEAPAAFIVKSDPDLSETAVTSYMKEHLSQHKQLEGGVTFVDELPKNQMGKLLRKVLKEMALKK